MSENITRLRWIGHACFKITSKDGGSMIIDPYDEQFPCPFVDGSAQIVFISHDHFEHNAAKRVVGCSKIIHPSVELAENFVECNEDKKTISVAYKQIPTYHDDEEGSIRGMNTVLVFSVDGIRFCHLGDIGSDLTDEQYTAIGEIDVLMIPIGGFYTIDSASAVAITNKLKPKYIIPMHFNIGGNSAFPIDGPEAFYAAFQEKLLVDGDTLDIDNNKLPEKPTIVVFQPCSQT